MRKQLLGCPLALIASSLTLVACGRGGGDGSSNGTGGSTQVAIASIAMRSSGFGPAIVARFSFATGWSAWSGISPAPADSVDTAINAKGEAIAIYRQGSDLYAARF